jgi:hypothetical protein
MASVSPRASETRGSGARRLTCICIFPTDSATAYARPRRRAADLDLPRLHVVPMTYDPSRAARLHPHSHRYVVTPAGRRVALFFSKSCSRVLRRGLARLDIPPPDDAPDPLARAWRGLDRELDQLVAQAQLAPP